MKGLPTLVAPTSSRRLARVSSRASAPACLLLGMLALTACTTPPGADTSTPGGVPIDTSHVSRNQDSRVLFVVIHYTVADLELSRQILTQPRYVVSAHYLVGNQPEPVIYRLVPEERRAWHSGASQWRGHAMLNASSIGIEIVHPGFRTRADGTREYLPFPPAQIDAVVRLLKDIVVRHEIRPERIVGHAEVLPSHKEDPGPTFPWKRLADEGLVAWPDAARVAAQRMLFESQLPEVAWFQEMLGKHGFNVPRHGELDAATRRVISAFQMRYRPSEHGGTPDAETAALLHVLVVPP